MPGPKINQPINLVRRSTRVSSQLKPTTTTTMGKTKIGLGLPKSSNPVKNENIQEVNKRKAEKSPFITKTVKRSAFGDITNDIQKAKNLLKDGTKNTKKTATVTSTLHKKSSTAVNPTATVTNNKTEVSVPKLSVKSDNITLTKENTVKKTYGPILKCRQPLRATTNTLPQLQSKKPSAKLQEKPHKNTLSVTEVKQHVDPLTKNSNTEQKELSLVKPPLRRSARLSDTGNSSGDSLFYVTALEELNITNSEKKSDKIDNQKNALPPGVEDFDKECGNDPYLVANYAFEIFSYLKSREPRYSIPEYMDKQHDLNKYMRSVLVDWMVEVQDNFELTHETLYMGVKMVDTYLSRKTIAKENLQLVGAVSLFIACKYEERCPPTIEEFVFICDNAYTREELLDMEFSYLETLDFDLGFPLSYRFLRRYARCVKTEMPLLTLARFVLEYALMDYSTVTMSDSKLAAACLHIARTMKLGAVWTPSLEYYTGYKLDDFKDIAYHLNDLLHKKPKESLKSVRIKYSQSIFFEVAKIPLVENSQL